MNIVFEAKKTLCLKQNISIILSIGLVPIGETNIHTGWVFKLGTQRIINAFLHVRENNFHYNIPSAVLIIHMLNELMNFLNQ